MLFSLLDIFFGGDELYTYVDLKTHDVALHLLLKGEELFLETKFGKFFAKIWCYNQSHG